MEALRGSAIFLFRTPIRFPGLCAPNMFHCTNQTRHLLQLHHVHGGLLGGYHHHDTQLPPPAGGHARDAKLGPDI